ncbi:Rieske 2Fe-2S domain-containing protein, partial [Arthrobacter sp. Soil736]|uniref:aromatic ring-hydroxylating oxygenase subunit alpha n=1 Tax=Arthrobacter sp. Soil736 TaxID=1736395 RepID=UPI000A8EF23D
MTTEVFTPSLIPTLPGQAYVSEEIFRAEQERIFEQMWFCAVRSADLDKPGAWRTVQVGRESVLISRTRKGGIRAFYNVCRHRGVKLCMEEQGETA